VPTPDRIPAALYAEIRTLCDLMLKTGYNEEATWLWMAVGSAAYCSSRDARKALEGAMTSGDTQNRPMRDS
jgi:hypothetical protein